MIGCGQAISTKDLAATGDPTAEDRLRALLATSLVVTAGAPGRVQAGVCGRSVTLAGAPELVAAISDALEARGIAMGDQECPGVRARVERSDDAITVVVDLPHNAPASRVVSSAETATTVIESWARSDVVAPLLATPAVAEIDLPPPRIETRIVLTETRGVQIFSAAETSVANDRTAWAGAEMGACIKLGAVCAAARARFAAVLIGTGPFDGQLDRHSVDLLVGGDLPMQVRGVTFSPGIAGGVGSIHTHFSDLGEQMGRETGGLRADAHATVSFPIGRRFAVDLAITVNVMQTTESEQSTTIKMPADPRVLGRLGIGLRYGGL